ILHFIVPQNSGKVNAAFPRKERLMPDERTPFFTTGQFAKLCSTTKETLFHYDSLGLLKPARVGENGYRYYAASQFFDFDLIAVLQSAGCSLQEIHAYMTHREPHAFAKLLRES